MRKYLILAILVIDLLLAGCLAQGVPSDVTLGQRVQTSGCNISGPYPDVRCTPGAINISATEKELCTPGYTSKVRSVSDKTKNEVYAEYGIACNRTLCANISEGAASCPTTCGLGREYEVDHYIPLELGGSNDIANLWPEAAEPRPGFHEKDKLENYLHRLVCEGKITLPEAQRAIGIKWVNMYEAVYT